MKAGFDIKCLHIHRWALVNGAAAKPFKFTMMAHPLPVTER